MAYDGIMMHQVKNLLIETKKAVVSIKFIKYQNMNFYFKFVQIKRIISYSISMTTRKPRPTETDGVDYFFVDEKSFVDKIAQGGLLEWARFVGNYYGTPKDNVDRLLDEGKMSF